MSFGHKEIDDIEVDDMKVKSHLDTSFNKSGLCVSEELIRKTMNAINNPSSTNIEEGKNVVVLGKANQRNKYIRRYAGVAAAVVLMIAGYQMVKNVGYLGTKSYKGAEKSSDMSRTSAKDDVGNTSEVSMENAATEEFAMSERSAESEVNFFGTEESKVEGKEDNNVGSVDADVIAPDEATAFGIPDIAITFDSSEKSDKMSEVMSFNQISVITPDEVLYLRITNVAKESSITLTEPIKIASFYEEMKKYSFNASSNSSANWYYIIELKKEEGAIAGYYTIWIGDNIMVQDTQDEEESYISYDAANQEELMAGLDKFFDLYVE